jgi:hypothetical protein
MKKVFLLTAVTAIFLLGFTSCKRCQVCTRSSSPTIRVCEKDYKNNTEYGLTLDGYEATGYACKNKL